MRDRKILMTISMPHSRYVITKAHEMGYKVVIANAYTAAQSAPKALADESAVIDASDTGAMVSFIGSNGIDGMFVTGSDAHLRFYCDICAASGLRAYCTREQADILSDKEQFKRCCLEHGLHVIPEYRFSSEADIRTGDIRFPVMVKSPDNAGGSKGMTLVYKEEDLLPAIAYAKANSPTQSFVIERYIDGDEFVINYMFVNGKPHVLYTKDYCKNVSDGKVMRDNAMISPSKYEKLFYDKADEKLRKMFADIGMTNGIIFLQCFVEDNELYFFEGGCRTGGTDEYFLWNSLYNVDFIKAMLNFSVSGDYGIPDLEEILEKTEQKKIYSVLNMMIGAGKIRSVNGFENVRDMKGVLCATLMRNAGDTVNSDATVGQIALRVMVEADSPEHYLSIIDRIYASVSFISDAGTEMLIPRIHLEDWVLNRP